MKIGFTGLDIPQGKIKYNDQNLNSLIKKDNPKKISPFFIEFIKDEFIKSEAIVIHKDKLLDLIISDMEKIENRLNRLIEDDIEKKFLNKCLEILENEKPLFSNIFNEQENKILLELSPYSYKPILIINGMLDINEIIKQILKISNYIFFYTTGKTESKGWLIKNNSDIITCASKIHSDLARGFIKGDVVDFNDYMQHYNFNECKSKGVAKVVDRDYIVKDKQIIEIRFNV